MGLRPSLLDYGEEHASPWPDLAPRQDEPPLLYLGFEGLGEEVDFSMRRALALVEANSGRELPRERAQSFWQRRHVVAQRFARGEPRDRDRRSPDVAYDYLHVAVPPSAGSGVPRTLPRRDRECRSGATGVRTVDRARLLLRRLCPPRRRWRTGTPRCRHGYAFTNLPGPRWVYGVRPRRRAAGWPTSCRASTPRPSTCYAASKQRWTRREFSTPRSLVSERSRCDRSVRT